jgi:hypothetical protein
LEFCGNVIANICPDDLEQLFLGIVCGDNTSTALELKENNKKKA